MSNAWARVLLVLVLVTVCLLVMFVIPHAMATNQLPEEVLEQCILDGEQNCD